MSKRIPQRIRRFVLRRDKCCVFCKSEDELTIHHKDRNKENNAVRNLVVVCDSCHITLEKLIDRVLRR